MISVNRYLITLKNTPILCHSGSHPPIFISAFVAFIGALVIFIDTFVCWLPNFCNLSHKLVNHFLL